MAFDAASFLLGLPKGTPEVFGNPDRVSITGTPVTDATVGEEWPGFTVEGQDGAEPYAYSVSPDGGRLPDWTSLDPDTGVLAPGTPTEAGVFADIVLRVTDDNGFTADLAPFTLTVVEGGGGEAARWTDPDGNLWTAPDLMPWTPPTE